MRALAHKAGARIIAFKMFQKLLCSLLITCLVSGCAVAKAIGIRPDHSGFREPTARSRQVGNQTIASLRKEHPRLMLTRDDFDRVRERCNGKDELATSWAKKLHARAERYLDDPPVKYAHPLL